MRRLDGGRDRGRVGLFGEPKAVALRSRRSRGWGGFGFCEGVEMISWGGLGGLGGVGGGMISRRRGELRPKGSTAVIPEKKKLFGEGSPGCKAGRGEDAPGRPSTWADRQVSTPGGIRHEEARVSASLVPGKSDFCLQRHTPSFWCAVFERPRGRGRSVCEGGRDERDVGISRADRREKGGGIDWALASVYQKGERMPRSEHKQ